VLIAEGAQQHNKTGKSSGFSRNYCQCTSQASTRKIVILQTNNTPWCFQLTNLVCLHDHERNTSKAAGAQDYCRHKNQESANIFVVARCRSSLATDLLCLHEHKRHTCAVPPLSGGVSTSPNITATRSCNAAMLQCYRPTYLDNI
jgi:hypothetical protein